MKRILLTIIGIISMVNMYATGFETINGLRYLINTEELTATLVADTVKYSGDIVVPEKVTLAGIDYPVVAFAKECFSNCSTLTSIDIPSSVTSLGDDCFADCRSLTSITIPSSVTSLGFGCFSSCSSLASVTIPSSVTSLGNYCFAYCSSLASITIPSSVTNLGGNCFDGCSSLASITIPSSVTSLGDDCFSSCSSLTSVTIPSSVTSLGGNCFDGCSKLNKVNCYAVNPPNTFSSLGQSTAILYVPAASVDKYKQAYGWKDFIAILPITGTESDTKGKCERPSITFANGKLHFESSTAGASYHYTINLSSG